MRSNSTRSCSARVGLTAPSQPSRPRRVRTKVGESGTVLPCRTESNAVVQHCAEYVDVAALDVRMLVHDNTDNTLLNRRRHQACLGRIEDETFLRDN